jgi:hypothetical protein
MRSRRAVAGWTLALGTALGAPSSAQGIGTAFTYQGRLTDAGSPPTGAYDFQFRAFDAATGGTQSGPTVTRDDVAVAGGLFTTSLDFGAVFTGNRRWLEIAVRPGASTGAYTPLLPRQELTPAPNSVFSSATPWNGLLARPAGFADDTDNDVLGGLTCPDGQVAKRSGGAWVCAADLDTPGWALAGNAGTSPPGSFLGTTDNQPLDIRVGNRRALRLEPAGVGAPNVLAGDNDNRATAGVEGASIGGGADNEVTDIYGTIGGGASNRVGDGAGTVEDRIYATVGGGSSNSALGNYSTVGGGSGNEARANNAVVSGGGSNSAIGSSSTVAGGTVNQATGLRATVGGGFSNNATAHASTVPGGVENQAGGDYSLAAGRQAKVRNATEAGVPFGDQGTFVWADAFGGDFWSTGSHQFLIRAANGVGINTNAPSSALHVAGTATMAGFRLPTGAGAGLVLTSDGTGVGTWQAGAAGGWSLGGNAGTSPATHFLGTTDNKALELRVNGERVLRLEPGTDPNIVAGDATNSVAAGVRGAVIAGGLFNSITAIYGTVSGGTENKVGDNGTGGPFAGEFGTVGGGSLNVASGLVSTVAGGGGNTASGAYATVGGGSANTASASNATVGGGTGNSATGHLATVAGGQENRADGNWAAASGGLFNHAGGDYSLAAGQRAKVRNAAQAGNTTGDMGTFVWADSFQDDFQSTGANQFLVRAFGGVGINTNTPQGELQMGSADDGAAFRFGNVTTRHHLVSNRDMVFNAFDPSGTAVVFSWRRNTTKFNENFFVDLMRLRNNGELNVVGNLTKGSGSFKIDHPLDPANRYLYHSFVESPDMKNVYDGVVTTDGQGYATVELPEWFEALNRDFRYQLTVVDEEDGPVFVQAKVVKGVAGNRFTLRTSVPGTVVCWQVTGIRQDPFAEAHRIAVEEDKPEAERGTYLHPEARR